MCASPARLQALAAVFTIAIALLLSETAAAAGLLLSASFPPIMDIYSVEVYAQQMVRQGLS